MIKPMKQLELNLIQRVLDRLTADALHAPTPIDELVRDFEKQGMTRPEINAVLDDRFGITDYYEET